MLGPKEEQVKLVNIQFKLSITMLKSILLLCIVQTLKFSLCLLDRILLIQLIRQSYGNHHVRLDFKFKPYWLN